MATNSISTYNYIIVGGGIYGCLVAWILSKQNIIHNYKILLLEKTTIGSGASGGLGQRGVRANGRHIAELPLMSIAYKLWPKIIKELNLNDNHYKQIGGLKLTENENMVKNSNKLLSDIALKQNKYGVKSQIITDKQILKAMEPTISSSVVGAIYCAFDDIGSHDITTKTVAKCAQNNGVIIKEYCAVKHLRKITKWKGITNQGEAYYATNSVFLLCNYGIKTLLKDSLNINFPQIQEMLPQIVIINGKNTGKINHLIGHFERTLAMKTLSTSCHNNDLMVSGGYQGELNNESGKYEPVRQRVIENIKQAKAAFSGLDIDEYDSANIIAKTDRLESICIDDDIPIIDRIISDDNSTSCELFYGFGWSGHGWAISPTIAQLLVQWARTKQCPSLLRPFSFARFKKRKDTPIARSKL